VASAGAALAWALLLRRRLESALAFALTAFIVGVIVLQAIDYGCAVLLPLDLAGTPPPDPRNARLRLLVTAGLQLFAALVVARLLVPSFRARGRAPG
jgi:hypothetical protein